MVEASPIELELRKLGLTEKEVRVYLAGLELGPSSVKKISEMAKITKPTAYEIIKDLERKGLFAETLKERKQKKKRLGRLKLKEIKNKKDFPGALIIYDKLIYPPSFRKPLALVIENKEIVKMVKGLINSL